MLTLSSQIRIIKNLTLSFKKGEKVHTKITDKELHKYKMYYNPERFESWTNIDFKVLVLLTLFKERITSPQALIKYLQETPTKELRKILHKKDDFLTYKNILEKDFELMKVVSIKNINQILLLYKEHKISFFYLYYYMYNHQDEIQGRIKENLYKRLRLLLSYFDIIKKTIEGLE